jgi:hypothetical protein
VIVRADLTLTEQFLTLPCSPPLHRSHWHKNPSIRTFDLCFPFRTPLLELFSSPDCDSSILTRDHIQWIHASVER